MTNSSLKSKIDLNDSVHLNSYFITKKIADSQFIRVNFTLELPKLSNRGSYQLLDIYVEREKIAQKFLLNEMNKNGDFLKKGAVYFIENIDAKLMVTNTETNYDSVLAEQGSHQLSISDFY